MSRVALLSMLAVCGACFTSPRPESSRLIAKTGGSFGTVTLVDRNATQGELIEVTNGSLTMLQSRRLFVIPFTEIRFADFTGFRTGSLNGSPLKSTIDRGKRSSRFPLGMPAEARDALLASVGQAKIDTLRASSR